MTTITIDGKEYDTEALSEETRGQLVSLQFVDSELARLNAKIAAMQTARMTYARVLKEGLDGITITDDEVSIEGLEPDLKFD